MAMKDLPENDPYYGTVTFHDLMVQNIYGVENPGKIKVITRTFKQRFVRSFKRTGKIIGVIFLILPIALFVHILLALSVLSLLASFGLFFWGLGDKVTYEFAEAVCPECKSTKKFMPFGSSRLKWPVTLHCADCGQTFTGKSNS
jgi:hypothetical protein